MKKTVAALLTLVSAAAFAGVNDLLVSFSTPGPDKYADGKTVLDNECYALVYTKGDVQETVLTYPGAKDGKCPPVVFIVDEETAANYKDGTWGVYLLDTRDFDKDASGQTLAALDAKGQPTKVNVTAAATDAVAREGSFSTANAKSGVAAGAYDLAAAKVAPPRITGIRVLGANVVVTVENTVPFVGYTLQSGDSVSNFSLPADAKSVSGDKTSEITLIAPKKDGAQFFKVSTVK